MATDSYAADVLTREKEKLKKKLAGVVAKCESSPASELFELMQEAQIKLNDFFDDRTNPDLIEWLEEAAKKEKRLKKGMSPKASDKLWDSRFKIEAQIADLNSAIYKLNIQRNI